MGDFLQAVIKASDECRQRHEQEAVDAAQARLQHARKLQASREEKQKQILAADAADEVDSPYCGSKASKGSIRVVESTQWKIH